jgi:hypothetical protein
MTDEEICNMPAGLEMDVLIADTVLGLVECDRWRAQRYYPPEYIKDKGDCEHEHCRPVGFCTSYSTDIAAAWEVVEKMRADGNEPDVWVDGDGDWRCSVFVGEPPKEFSWYAPTAPLAICRAALLAVNGDNNG